MQKRMHQNLLQSMMSVFKDVTMSPYVANHISILNRQVRSFVVACFQGIVKLIIKRSVANGLENCKHCYNIY